MKHEILETCDTRAWADVLLKQYAATLKAIGAQKEMGVKLEQMRGKWQVVLVRRYIPEEPDYGAYDYGGVEEG